MGSMNGRDMVMPYGVGFFTSISQKIPRTTKTESVLWQQMSNKEKERTHLII